MVFQDYALFPHMTVAQNISFGLELKGMSKADIRKRLDEIMTFLELDGFGARYPASCPVGNVSVWLWRVRLRLIRRCYCWTSLWAHWMPSCAGRFSRN